MTPTSKAGKLLETLPSDGGQSAANLERASRMTEVFKPVQRLGIESQQYYPFNARPLAKEDDIVQAHSNMGITCPSDSIQWGVSNRRSVCPVGNPVVPEYLLHPALACNLGEVSVNGLPCMVTCGGKPALMDSNPEMGTRRNASGDRDRLSERASLGEDAIVGSHGNVNHESVAEMAAPVRMRTSNNVSASPVGKRLNICSGSLSFSFASSGWPFGGVKREQEKVGYMLEPLDHWGIMGIMSSTLFPQPRLDYPSLGENVEDRDNQQERLARLTRLGALLECEGHFTIGMMPASKTRDRISFYPTMGFTNTDPRLVDEVAEVFHDHGVDCLVRCTKPRGVGPKRRYDLMVANFPRVLKALDLVIPYLRTKRKQAALLREFVQSRLAAPHGTEYSDSEWSIIYEIRRLNGRKPNVRALARAKAALESPESIRRPRSKKYLERYVKMCADLQRELERTPETSVPPMLQRWVKK